MENKMIDFAKGTRTTSFFKDLAIIRIKIAYRIMEYLAPDTSFPPKIDGDVKTLLLKGQFEKAYNAIHDELDIEIDSSSWDETIEREAVELMKYLLPLYESSKKSAKEEKRLKLIQQLKELDETD